MQTQALIIEDEPAAARRLEKLIHQIDPKILITGRLDSVSSAIRWFEQNPHPDLIFLDIHLGDGLSFGIFDSVEIRCPIIFTTAYDEFAIKAFKLNSIDYLLKPIKPHELQFSIEKYRKQGTVSGGDEVNIQALLQSIKNPEDKWKQRFVVNYGDKIRAVETGEVAYFMILEKNTFLVTHNNESFGINYTLEQLENMLNPVDFYRVNRKYIVAFASIKNMWVYSRSRVKLQLAPSPPEDVIVSTDRSSGFKDWLNK
jgi:DNA-binding LytR/AlgR family response regulator